MHESQGRPPARVEPSGAWTQGDGCAPFTFYSDMQRYSGEWRVHSVAYGWPWVEGSMDIAVGLFDPPLHTLPPASWYQLDGETAYHPWSHSGTFSTVVKIQQITQQFFNEFGVPPCVNDMSILWGGSFDIEPPYGQFWHPPHQAHVFGTNADIPWRADCYLNTTQRRNRFAEIAGAPLFVAFSRYILQATPNTGIYRVHRRSLL